MRQMYFERNEKLGFFEELVFNHELDEDVMLIKRTGFSTEFILLCGLIVTAVLAVICF